MASSRPGDRSENLVSGQQGAIVQPYTVIFGNRVLVSYHRCLHCLAESCYLYVGGDRFRIRCRVCGLILCLFSILGLYRCPGYYI